MGGLKIRAVVNRLLASICGLQKDIQEFKSGDGKYLYYCEVKGDRVHLASAPTAFETQPNFNYTRTDYQHFYVVKKPDITITTKYPDGYKDEKTFSIKGLKKKL